MVQRAVWVLLFGSVIGSALVAGVFLAFSSFVMAALGRLPPAQGIAAMQSINVTVIGSVFLAVLVLTALGCGALAIGGVWTWDQGGSLALFVGAALYVVGVVGVTSVFNVPRNDALAAVDASSSAGAALWESYLTQWTAWNHVRALASFGSTVAFLVAIVRRAGLI